MPKKNVDYSRTVMYKIVCNDLSITDYYVGHTTEFTKRKSQHKFSCISQHGKSYNLKVYQFIRDFGCWSNWSMIMIEKYPCQDHLEATKRERYWVEQLNATLNSIFPQRTSREYSQQYNLQNAELIAKNRTIYYKHNKDTLALYNKQYNLENKEKIAERRQNMKVVITCECGCSYTRSNMLRHFKSTKHLHYEQNKSLYIIRKGLDLIKIIDNNFNNNI